MNRDRFDHSLSGWLADQSSTPTYLDEAMARTRATRQRPAWSFPERWLPMQLTMRRAYVPRPFFYLALVALLAIAVAAAALAIGAARQVAPPFGPARNGLLAFDQSGSIMVARPGQRRSSGRPRHRPGRLRTGLRTRRGHLAFYAQQDGVDTLFVARPDGSEPVAVSRGAPSVEWTWRCGPRGRRTPAASPSPASAMAIITCTSRMSPSPRASSSAPRGSRASILPGRPMVDGSPSRRPVTTRSVSRVCT